jgi:hypothetical protein
MVGPLEVLVVVVGLVEEEENHVVAVQVGVIGLLVGAMEGMGWVGVMVFQ